MLETENTFQSIRVNILSRDNNDFRKEVIKAYKKYTNGDWGKVMNDQAAYNDEAVTTGMLEMPIIGVYPTMFGNLYIVTSPTGKTKLQMEEEI